MIGYNPPTSENPLVNLPNTRITKNIREPDPAGIGIRYTVEFTGPFNELDNEEELLSAASAWCLKENLLGFGLDYPIGRVFPITDKDNEDYGLCTRKLTYRHPGL